jgi:membrane protein DedA with SNARE-associated domain
MRRHSLLKPKDLFCLSIAGLLAEYGPWLVFAVVALESAGIPLPGETTLIGGAVLAATRHDISIFSVVFAAVAGAITGDNLGYWAGRYFGPRFVRRYTHHLLLTEDRVSIARYLFRQYGGWLVFFGRFVALLRAFAAILAGANGMAWNQFLLFNSLGAICWASLFGFGAYGVGAGVNKLAGGFEIAFLAIAAVVLFFLMRAFHRYERQLMKLAREDEQRTRRG